MAKLKSGTGTMRQSALRLSPTTTATAPDDVEGTIYYDSTSDTVKVRNASSWETLSNLFTTKATGGTITSYADGGTTYVVHTFITSGTFSPTSSFNVDILAVAGGGGGGWDVGGGGGAGGMGVWPAYGVTATNYTIVVGSGGAGSSSGNAVASNGGLSSFGALTDMAGGGGAGPLNVATPGAGGSGGGGGGYSGGNQTGGTGAGTIGTLLGTTYSGGATVDTIGKYFGGDGGSKVSGAVNYQGAGGGGAGGDGANGIQHAAGDLKTDNFGIGLPNWYRTGSDVMYAEGGGGGNDGAYGYGRKEGKEGAERPDMGNTGNGAGGDGTTNGQGKGADGIVVIRYTV